jgi:hypothetical protein
MAKTTSCVRCRRTIIWPERFCSQDCRALGPAVEMSVPVTIMRNRSAASPSQPFDARAAVLEDRKLAATTGKAPQTTSVRAAETTLSKLRSPAETRRVFAAEEDAMYARLGLGR